MAQAMIDIELHSATVRPGHTLLVACPGGVSPERAQKLKADLMAELPGVKVLVVAGAAQLLVYDPDDGAQE